MPPIDPQRQQANQPRLTLGRTVFEAAVDRQIAKGENLLDRPPVEDETQLTQLRQDFETWDEFNSDLLRAHFSTERIANEYKIVLWQSGGRTPREKSEYVRSDIAEQNRKLKSIRERSELFQEVPAKGVTSAAQQIGTPHPDKRIFIGHGHSGAWRELKDFITDRLRLEFEEFNRVPVAGVSTKERLIAMLDNSSMAFLICTAEDDRADGTQHARENVVHECGLFQGRLGFTRAIVLLEDECTAFSNIDGLGQIRFPKGNIKASFEEVRQVLEREGLISQ